MTHVRDQITWCHSAFECACTGGASTETLYVCTKVKWWWGGGGIGCSQNKKCLFICQCLHCCLRIVSLQTTAAADEHNNQQRDNVKQQHEHEWSLPLHSGKKKAVTVTNTDTYRWEAGLTMDVGLLETLSWGKVEVSCHLWLEGKKKKRKWVQTKQTNRERNRKLLIPADLWNWKHCSFKWLLEITRLSSWAQLILLHTTAAGTPVTSDLVDLQEAVHLTALVLLLLHLLDKPFSLTLLDGLGTFEGPAPPPVRLSHIITGVTAPAHKGTNQQLCLCVSVWHTESVCMCMCVCVLLQVLSLCSIAALASVRVQWTRVKHFSFFNIDHFWKKKKTQVFVISVISKT